MNGPGKRAKTVAPIATGILLILGGLAMFGHLAVSVPSPQGSFSFFAPVIRTHATAAFSGVAIGSTPGINGSAGDAVYAFVVQEGVNGTPTVNDSSGDHFVQKGSATKAGTVTTRIYEADNVSASVALIVSVSFPSPQTFSVGAVDVAGAGPSPDDAVGPATYGAQGTEAQPKVTTTVVGDLVLGVIGDNENSSVAGVLGSASVNSSTAASAGSVITLGIVSERDLGTGPFTIWGDMGPATSVLSLSFALAIKPAPLATSTPRYTVSFSAVGLPPGTNWSVLLGGTLGSATTPAPLNFSEPNNTYAYAVGPVVGFRSTPSAGIVTVAGANVSVGPVNFTLLPPPPTHPIDHVVVIVLENANTSLITPSSAPYESYLGAQYARATQYYSMCHPSLANYIALGSGYDNCIQGAATTGEGNLADLLERNGLTWMDYSESLPANCTTKASGLYDPGHNPFVWFSDIAGNQTRCAAHLVDSSVFNASVAAGTLANYSFYTPNLDNDGHNTGVAFADAWLRGFLGPILNGTGSYNSSAERVLVAHTAFFVTWDEANNTDFHGYLADGITNAYCLAHTGTALSACGGQLYMLAVSPYSHGLVSSGNATHINLLSTVEWLFSLPGDGGWDGTQYFPAMTGLFSFSSNGFTHPE